MHVAERLERWTFNSEASSSSPALPAGFVHGSPKVKSWAMLVNSQLACLRTVGILNLVKFNLNYLFQAFAWAQ